MRTAGDAPPGIQRTGAVYDRPGVILPENLSACRAHGCRPRNIFFAARGAGEKDGTFFRRASAYAGALVFQSTRPLRGATAGAALTGQHLSISIHAPLAGRDTNKGANQNERHPIC